ncbi:hypothetical protein FD754_003363 [Muntiacus muntjak]|uniref:Uncharacterized protein n=1 Tax=Muntiacus muntjak TaxID=9888 RepID=A0A5N3WDS6_MUNMU|nr:hypothetical protein FD754_003363 [Muntiacus muntjak]
MPERWFPLRTYNFLKLYWLGAFAHHNFAHLNRKDFLNISEVQHMELSKSICIFCIIHENPMASLGIKNDTWTQMRKMYKYVSGKHSNSHNWFFLAHPTIFFTKDVSQPFCLGHTVTSGNLDFMTVEGGEFLQKVEDSKGRILFNTKPTTHLIQETMPHNPEQVVEGCCSDTAITFNGLTPENMIVMTYGVYQPRAFGHYFSNTLIFLSSDDSENHRGLGNNRTVLSKST